jgi:bifunctional UDP-N-acetylglucosamine pyrophosphorylase / glucosamine-1-phosphate N-acetyltransferase
MTHPSLSLIILAAGKGTRMKSDKAKVLHEIFFAPMVQHVITAVNPLHPARTVVVVGHQGKEVEKTLQGFGCEFVCQEQQLGTGHAVLAAEKAIPEENSTAMILCGDTPLIRSETLIRMYDAHLQYSATLTLMTTILSDPTNYGRILTSPGGEVSGIVEQKDASPEQLLIHEVNAGIYCVDKSFLFSALKMVDTNNSQQEMYLTDIVKHAVDSGHRVAKFTAPFPTEVLGVNSRIELAQAQHELQMRRNHQLMMQGVTIVNPATVAVAPTVEIGIDTVLESGVRIFGNSRIGKGCIIGQGSILHNCKVGDHTRISPYCCLNDTSLPSGKELPPFTTIAA